jgi:hypothetical protein
MRASPSTLARKPSVAGFFARATPIVLVEDRRDVNRVAPDAAAMRRPPRQKFVNVLR